MEQQQQQEMQRRYEAAKKLAQEMQSRIERSTGRLDAAKRQYADLVARAKEAYGVGTLTELDELARRYEQENRAALDAFDLQAAQVRLDLEKIEAALDEAGV